MLSRLHKQLGPAGLTVAIAALVLAVGGTALAASALTGKQKKEVEKIAKKYAGKPGAAGAQGPAGPAGPQGAVGPKGDTGSAGSAGAAGASVTNTKLNPGNANCLEGGAEFKVGSGSSTFACNGEEGPEGPEGPAGGPGPEGSPWLAGGTLPPGETETGSYSLRVPSAQIAYIPLSFPLPLPVGEGTEGNRVAVNYVKEGTGPTAACPGTPADPSAEPGNLCVYEGSSEEFSYSAEIRPDNGESGIGAARTGAVLLMEGKSGFAYVVGTWAVTARE